MFGNNVLAENIKGDKMKTKTKNRHYINIKLVFYNNVFEHIQTKPEIHNKRYGYVV